MSGWFFLAAAGVLAVAAAVALVSRARRRRPEPGDGEVRQIRVLMLGPRESGKTILMASMWRELHVAGRLGVSLVAETGKDRKHLDDLCVQIEDPTKYPPPGTTLGDGYEWKFVARAQDRTGQAVDAFRVCYIDPPGEKFADMSLDPEQSTVPAQLREAYQSADIVMGVIDGQRVARLMRGQPGGKLDREFLTTLRQLSDLLGDKRAGKALHIVITKWDLLAGFTVEDVLARLKKETPFRNLLEAQRFGGYRVIPVAALGTNGFVRENRSPEAENPMERTDVTSWEPEHVAAPLACAIPDALAADTARLREKRRARSAPITLGQVSAVFFLVALALGVATVHLPAAAAAAASMPREIILKKSLDSLQDKLARAIRRAGRRKPPKSLDRTSALVRVLAFLGSQVAELEKDEPAARLRNDTGTVR
jgi:double-GTPase-like protein